MITIKQAKKMPTDKLGSYLAKTGPSVNGGPGIGLTRKTPTLKDVQANKQTKANFMSRLKKVK